MKEKVSTIIANLENHQTHIGKKTKKKTLRNQLKKELKNDPKFWDLVWTEYASMKPIEAIARGMHVPKMTLYGWIREDPKQKEMKALVDELRADSSAEKIQEMGAMDFMNEDGSFDHHKARITLDSLKWSAEKGNPQKYGYKQEISVTKTVREEHIHELREMMKDVTPHSHHKPKEIDHDGKTD